ncbi:MAG: hypothetical protein IKU42_01930 [Oscillospiraceae bacterium]|nr:hypothetical protein [Oscillospiraceae bacterium]
MKKTLTLILTIIFLFSLNGCGKNTEEIDFSNNSVNITLSEFISEYNSSLRYDNNSVVLWNTTDAEYIDCAKTLINGVLKNPSGAVYNESYVVEKDRYGRAIICLDVSAQNSFGGYVRKTYLVCIQKVRANDFTYYENFYWIENTSATSYETLKKYNDFGINPNDVELKGQFIEEENLSFVNSILISESSILSHYLYNAKFFDWEIYTNEDNQIVALSMTLQKKDENSITKYQIKKNITAVISILSDTKEEKAEKIFEEIFDNEQLLPNKNSKEHKANWLYECVLDGENITFFFISVSNKNYKNNFYWSPLTEKIYFEKLAKDCLEKEEFESAIAYFEQAEIFSDDLLLAYYEQGKQLFENNRLEDSIYYFALAKNYKDAKEKINESYYLLAKESEESGDFYSAYNYYSCANNYLDSANKKMECCYKHGNYLFEEENYVEAAKYFNLSKGYNNADEMEKECYYLYGTLKIKVKKFDEGIEYLQKCRGYKDTDDIVLTIFYDAAMIDVQNYISNCNIGTSNREPSRGDKGLELYNIAVASLKKCENYKDSSYWLEVITTIEEICVSANKANNIRGSLYSPSLSTFTISIEGDNIILYEPNLKKSAEIQLELTFTKDKSYFSAFIPSVWYSGMNDDDGDVVRMVVSLFTNVFSDQAFRVYLDESFGSDDTQKTVKVEYNDYIIEITTTPSHLYRKVSIIINGYLK